MRRSGRASKRKYGRPTELSEDELNKSTTDSSLQQLGSAYTNNYKIDQILHQWLDRMLPHIWYKILPESLSDVANIAFAMGQSIDLVNKTLIHLQYLKRYKDDYRFNISKF